MSQETLAANILERIEQLLIQSDEKTKPMEIDPQRSELFELFVTAHGAGYLEEDATEDLSAEGICQKLADKWGLKESLQNSLQQQQAMEPEGMKKMRLIWSVMRMWMEWDYAWSRWEEFHLPKDENAT